MTITNTVLIFSLLSIGYFATLVLILVYEFKHIKELKSNMFFLAKFTQCIAWFLLILRGGEIDYVSIALANSLLFITYAYEVIALLEIKAPLSRRTKRTYNIFLFASISCFHYIFFFHNEEAFRIACYAFTNAILYLTVINAFFDQRATRLMKFLCSMYILFACICICRGLLAFKSVSLVSLFSPEMYQLFFLLTVFVFSSFATIGYILLQKQQLDRELVYFATYDDLTHTLNRRTFTKRSEQIMKRLCKKKRPLSYILFDVDHFKSINDTYGHIVGDQVLQHLTKVIQKQLCTDAIFGRYGGDEFAILLPNYDETASTKMAKSIQQALNSSSIPTLPPFTLSIGVLTTVPSQETQLQELYTTCDRALYKAKRNGRNNLFRTQLHENEIKNTL